MAIANFDEFCMCFCELAGFAAVSPQPGANGERCFSIRLRGIELSALALSRASDSVFMVAELGVPGPGDEGCWVVLLESNSAVPGAGGARFSRNPHTGQAVIQWTFRLPDVMPLDVYRSVSRMVDVALRWRYDRSVDTDALESAHDAAALSGTVAACDARAEQAARRFHALYSGLCDTRGEPVDPPAGNAAACSVTLRISGVDVVMAHLPRMRPDVALVGIPFGDLSPASPQAHAAALLDANFVLATQPHGAAFCRDCVSGDVLLRYAYPLLGGSSAQCLAHMESVAAFVQRWTATSITPIDAVSLPVAMMA